MAISAGLTACHLIFPFDVGAPPDAALEIGTADAAAQLDAGEVHEASKPQETGAPDAKSVRPTVSWATQLGGPEDDLGRRVALDSKGNVYVTGEVGDLADLGDGPVAGKGGKDAFLVSLAVDGAHRWHKSFASPGWDSGWSVAVDSSDRVYVTGQFSNTVDFGGGPVASTSASSTNAFVAAFEADGSFRWAQPLTTPGYAAGYGVVVDTGGNLYVVGSFDGTLTSVSGTVTGQGGTDLFMCSLTSSGDKRWIKGFGGGWSGGIIRSYGLGVDSSGNLYLAGHFSKSLDIGDGQLLASKGGFDIFVTSLDAGGGVRWTKHFGGPNTEYAWGMAVDPGGVAYVTGSFTGTVDLGAGPFTSQATSDIYLLSLTSKGAHRWARQLGGPASDMALDVAVDVSGNPYLVGDFAATADLGGGAVTSKGGIDLFVSSFAPTGVHRWTLAGATATSEWGRGIAVGAAGSIYLLAYFDGTTDVGTGPIVTKGNKDILMIKLTP
jgi:hypothetical protein